MKRTFKNLSAFYPLKYYSEKEVGGENLIFDVIYPGRPPRPVQECDKRTKGLVRAASYPTAAGRHHNSLKLRSPLSSHDPPTWEGIAPTLSADRPPSTEQLPVWFPARPSFPPHIIQPDRPA